MIGYFINFLWSPITILYLNIITYYYNKINYNDDIMKNMYHHNIMNYQYSNKLTTYMQDDCGVQYYLVGLI